MDTELLDILVQDDPTASFSTDKVALLETVGDCGRRSPALHQETLQQAPHNNRDKSRRHHGNTQDKPHFNPAPPYHHYYHYHHY